MGCSKLPSPSTGLRLVSQTRGHTSSDSAGAAPCCGLLLLCPPAECHAALCFAGSLATAGLVTLKALVITGAVLQVVARGAKFSLFKPAEEMVYIGLDDESRTKGG